MVESKSGLHLWDAKVTAQSKRSKDGDASKFIIDAYRVEYTSWGSRFTEWVEPARVVEPNENNRLIQVRFLRIHSPDSVSFPNSNSVLQDYRVDEMALSRYGIPPELTFLEAISYLNARDRARGQSLLPDFARIAYVEWHQSSNTKTLGLMKAALFAIEAALPVGCIDNRDSGPWRKSFSDRWKRTVEEAEGPELLIRCTILLEDTISPDWIKEDIGHLRSCLPARWKAIGEASPSALAVRVILLDRSIMYETIDRKRYSSRKRKR